MDPATQHDSATPDLLTLVGIAALAGALTVMLHEGLGHGGACLLVGGRVLSIDAVSENCSLVSRWVDAGGSFANLGIAALCWLLARRVRRASHWAFFLWLMTTLNLFEPAGYLLFSGVANIGDWSDILRGVHPVWPWRVGEAVAGAAAYYAVVWFSIHQLRPFLDHNDAAGWRRARRLCLVPYFTFGILCTIAGTLNPLGPRLIMISAAAGSFGGASGLYWMWNFTRNPRFARPGLELPRLLRSPAWIAAGSLAAAIFIGYFGPGLNF